MFVAGTVYLSSCWNDYEGLCHWCLIVFHWSKLRCPEKSWATQSIHQTGVNYATDFFFKAPMVCNWSAQLWQNWTSALTINSHQKGAGCLVASGVGKDVSDCGSPLIEGVPWCVGPGRGDRSVVVRCCRLCPNAGHGCCTSWESLGPVSWATGDDWCCTVHWKSDKIKFKPLKIFLIIIHVILLIIKTSNV